MSPFVYEHLPWVVSIGKTRVGLAEKGEEKIPDPLNIIAEGGALEVGPPGLSCRALSYRRGRILHRSPARPRLFIYYQTFATTSPLGGILLLAGRN